MFLSNPAKSFLATLIFLLSTAGCGLIGTGSNTAGPTITEPKSRIPFRTKEPENFQCEIVETAGETVRRKRIAKKGTWRRVDFDLGEQNQRAVLVTDKEYLIDVGRRVYAERPPAAGGTPQFSDLTQELLNTGGRSDFEESGRDGQLVIYRVRPADSTASEIVVHFDESIGMAVKQEFFSLSEAGRSLRYTVEMVNFTPEPDAALFSPTPGFRPVPLDEILNSPDRST